MGSARSKASWTGTVASVAAALAAIVVVPSSGCSTISPAACGDEPAAAACARLGFECDKVVVCYACGVAKRIDCGACADTQTCGGGGKPHVCWPPLVDGGGEAGAASGDADTGEASTSGDADTGGAAASDASSSDASASDASSSDASISDAAPNDASDDGASAAPSDASAAPSDAAATTTVIECPEDAVPPEDAPPP